MSPAPGPIVQECVEGYLFRRPPLELLVLRRPPARGRIWVPVSGKVEPSDPDFEAAARREVAEETGLEDPRSVFALDWHVPFTADNGETWRLHAYGFEAPQGFEPTIGAEHDAFEWVPPEEALRRLHFPDNQEAVRRLLQRIAPG